MRAPLIVSCALALVACGPSGADSDAQADASSEMTLAALDDAASPPTPAADDGAAGSSAAALPAAYADADVSAGSRVWFLCAACHQINDGTANAVGPDLYGIFGKTAATNEAFPLYSPALKDSGIVWTAETLDAWLANPRDVLPTTTMIFPGVAKEDDRKNLIAYLWEETGGAGE